MIELMREDSSYGEEFLVGVIPGLTYTGELVRVAVAGPGMTVEEDELAIEIYFEEVMLMKIASLLWKRRLAMESKLSGSARESYDKLLG